MTKEKLLGMIGDFTWLFGMEFFIETAEGSFIWRDPEYGGDNTIKPYDGTWEDFYKEHGLFGRDKGKHAIADYCGDQFTLVLG